MKKRVYLIVTILLVTLSCNLPHPQNQSNTTIKSVKVTPPSGERDFRLELAYEFQWNRDNGNLPIFCGYIPPSGSRVPIESVSPEGLDKDNEFFTRVKVMAFSVKPVGGKIQPGTYTAVCETENPGTQVGAPFIVTETQETPTPTLTPSPSPTPTSLLTLGRITFSLGTYRSDRLSGGGELDDVTRWCIPEVMIAADGTLSGSCTYNGKTALLAESTVIVTVTGKAVRGGDFVFSYQVSESGPNGWKSGESSPGVNISSTSAQWYIFYTGSGKFTSPDRAEGSANFEYTCMSGASNLLWCSGQELETFKGTIDWNFE